MVHIVPVLEVNGVLNEGIDDRGVGIFSPQNHHQELEQDVKKERKATSKEDVAKRQRVKIQASIANRKEYSFTHFTHCMLQIIE